MNEDDLERKRPGDPVSIVKLNNVGTSSEQCGYPQYELMGQADNEEKTWDTNSDHGPQDVVLGGRSKISSLELHKSATSPDHEIVGSRASHADGMFCDNGPGMEAEEDEYLADVNQDAINSVGLAVGPGSRGGNFAAISNGNF